MASGLIKSILNLEGFVKQNELIKTLLNPQGFFNDYFFATELHREKI
jgi:hypothetical protein